jgi:hypothetical protein
MFKFSGLFATRKVSDGIKAIHSRNRALGELGEVIVSGAYAMTESFRTESSHENDATMRDRGFEALLELQWFLLFLVSYSAHRIAGSEKRGALCNDLAPLIVDSTIESLLGHWPEDYKKRIKSEYYEDLQSAEQEYGTCESILPKDGVNLAYVASWRCAKIIAQKKGNATNPGAIMGGQYMLTQWLDKSKFFTLVEDAVKTY